MVHEYVAAYPAGVVFLGQLAPHGMAGSLIGVFQMENFIFQT